MTISTSLAPLLESVRFDRPAATFFDSPPGVAGDLVAGDVAFLGIPSDATHTSRIGTRYGPRALRRETQALMRGLDAAGPELVDAGTGGVFRRRPGGMRDVGDAPLHATDPAALTEGIAAMTEAIVMAGALPVAVGGDHYTSYPACLGVSRAWAALRPGARFGFVQIDGHLDFCDRLGAWGTMNHATNARRTSELPNIGPMAWIGVSGWVDGADVDAIEGMGGLILSAEDVHAMGAPAAARRALEHAMAGCEAVYVTLDVDAMDAGFLPGTGSVVHSEITPRQYLDLVAVLAAAPLCGLDMVEVSPPLDPSGRSERIAAGLLLEALRPRLMECVA